MAFDLTNAVSATRQFNDKSNGAAMTSDLTNAFECPQMPNGIGSTQAECIGWRRGEHLEAGANSRHCLVG
jgi:hypothetical protein